MEETRETQISNFDFTLFCDHDVGRLQISVHDPVAVQVYKALQELIQDRLDGPRWYGLALWLIVVMDDLQEVVLCIFENNEDTFVFKDNLRCVNNIWMCQLRAQSHLSYGRL